MKSREVEVRGAEAKGEADALKPLVPIGDEGDARRLVWLEGEAKGEADALKPLVPIGDEGDARRLVWLEGGESSRRSMSLSPRVTAVSKNVSSNR